MAYPETEPYASGRLAVGDGHDLYWETCGNPDGTPAVVLHGGPGSGCSPWWRRLFDPDAYRIVLFDQRGCGRSRPWAGDPATALVANTTHELVRDVERLRRHLGVDAWLVLGGSWGSTLGLAYAQRHPERVRALVLFSVVTTTRREVEWVTRSMGRFHPLEWERFRDGVPAEDRDGSLVDAYARLLADPDPAVRARAARDWCAWEDAHVRVRPDDPPDPRFDDPGFRFCFARLVTHYWRHAAWLEDGELERGMARVAGIPGVLIQGGADRGAPVDVPTRLARSWPDGVLEVVEGEGHGRAPGRTERVIAWTDRFARTSPDVNPAG